MAHIDSKNRTIIAKVVYYGCGLCGKTTNLEFINSHSSDTTELMALSTEGDRTIFFDFLPLSLGKVRGFRTEFKLYAVPGQVRYNMTRKLVLKDVDGVVFVVDSQPSMLRANIDSLANLLENLVEQGTDIENLPIVFQYNKRDLPDVMKIAALERKINKRRYPHFAGSAINGEGVFETLDEVCRLVFDSLSYGAGSAAEGEVAPRSAQPASQQHRDRIEPAPVSEPAVAPSQDAPTPVAAALGDASPELAAAVDVMTQLAGEMRQQLEAIRDVTRARDLIDDERPGVDSDEAVAVLREELALQRAALKEASESAGMARERVSQLEAQLRDAQTEVEQTRGDLERERRTSTAGTNDQIAAHLAELEDARAALKGAKVALETEKERVAQLQKQVRNEQEAKTATAKELVAKSTALKDAGTTHETEQKRVAQLEKQLRDAQEAKAATLREAGAKRETEQKRVAQLEKQLRDEQAAKATFIQEAAATKEKADEQIGALQDQLRAAQAAVKQAAAKTASAAPMPLDAAAKSDDAKPDDAKAAEAKPATASPDDAKAAEAKPAAAKPDEAKPDDAKPDDARAVKAAAKPVDETDDPFADNTEHQNARRVARVMISDLLLYNKKQILEGIRDGNIEELLQEELGEARNTYDSRVPERIRKERDHLTLELEQMLEKQRKKLAEPQPAEPAAAAKPEEKPAETKPVEVEPAAKPQDEQADRFADNKEHQNAKRVARVMISDLLLYNRKQVLEGIRDGNIEELLQEELGEARNTYESRVPERIRNERDYLTLELEQMLEKQRQKVAGQKPTEPAAEPDKQDAAAKPADAKPIEAKPAEAQPPEAHPAEVKPAEAKPAEAQPAEAKPVEAEPAAKTQDEQAGPFADNKEHQNAKRVARVMISDLLLYNRKQILEGIRDGNVEELLQEELGEARNTYESRVPERIRKERDYLTLELEQMLEKQRQRLAEAKPAEKPAAEKPAAEKPAAEKPAEAKPAEAKRIEAEPAAKPRNEQTDPFADNKEHQNARRIARVMISDLLLYNRKQIIEGIRDGNVEDLLQEELGEARNTFESRVPERIRKQRDYLTLELEQMLEKQRNKAQAQPQPQPRPG